MGRAEAVAHGVDSVWYGAGGRAGRRAWVCAVGGRRIRLRVGWVLNNGA
jgi:hypothetical protein